MLKKQLSSLALLGIWILGGCESAENADRVAKLQEQIGRMAQQLNETKNQVDGLQEANQRSVRSIEELATMIERLTSVSSPSAKSQETTQSPAFLPATKSSQKLFAEEVVSSHRIQGKSGEGLAAKVIPLTPATSGEKNLQSEERQSATNKETVAMVAAISCTRVWKQLGQGKSAEAAAQALGVSSAAIHACEQKVGRSGGS